MSADGDSELTALEILRTLGPLAGFLRSTKGALTILVNFLQSPVKFVFSLISFYILNGIFNVINVVAGAVLGTFDFIVGSLNATLYGDGTVPGLIPILRPLGLTILDVFASINRMLTSVAASAGPFGPPLIIAFVAISLYVLYRVAVALLGELPVGSSIVDLLGLR